MTEHGLIFKPDLGHLIFNNLKDVTRRTGTRYNKWEVGDILVVREKWRIKSWREFGTYAQSTVRIEFADGHKRFAKISFDDAPKLFRSDDGARDFFAWRSPIHMYYWAARSRGPIVSITREPLWAITDEDAIREGIPADSRHPRQAFAELWDTIHGGKPTAWKHNPEVTRIKFEVE